MNRFRVRSKDLPNFRAITLEWSGNGVVLETEDSVAEGTEVDLFFEFDRLDLSDFGCRARVLSSQREAQGRQFETTLEFIPDSDELRITLARTATVLHAHSETDLETLLEQAKRIDPDRAQIFERAKAKNRASSVATTEAAVAQSSSEIETPPCLGLYIPLPMVIRGYQLDAETGLLTVAFVSQQQEHRLYFPNCRFLSDFGTSIKPAIVALFCTPESEAINRLPKPFPAAGWKHYRFLMADRMPILEVVSAPCRPNP